MFEQFVTAFDVDVGTGAFDFLAVVAEYQFYAFARHSSASRYGDGQRVIVPGGRHHWWPGGPVRGSFAGAVGLVAVT